MDRHSALARESRLAADSASHKCGLSLSLIVVGLALQLDSLEGHA
jgi:hypothetical protein